MNRKCIRVFEHSTLRVDETTFPANYFDRLVRYNESQGNRLFQVGHRRIRFLSHVGVIQVGDLTIEVLPKVDRHEKEDTTKWRNALLEMLSTCRLVRIESSDRANLAIDRKSLLDLYFEAFLSETRQLLREGLRKSYRNIESNRSSLKGRLLFKEQIKKNLVHRERFFTRSIEYNRNFLLNQILVVALKVLSRIASHSIASEAQKLLVELEDISPISVSRSTFDRIVLDRDTSRYKEALKLARLIILNFAPDLRGGSEDVIAILFDMNQLFEEYVYRCLKRTCKDLQGIKVTSQKSKVFWTSERSRKSIRPDILIEFQYQETISRTILDTKWKVPKDNLPDDADLKQMYAYNLQFDAKNCVLLYPRCSSSKNTRGRFANVQDTEQLGDLNASLMFIELFNDVGRLNRKTGKQFLDLALGEYDDCVATTPSHY